MTAKEVIGELKINFLGDSDYQREAKDSAILMIEEIELYKKALEIACEDIDEICQSYTTAEQCKNCIFACRHADLVESYLMKAREE